MAWAPSGWPAVAEPSRVVIQLAEKGSVPAGGSVLAV
jgi:hypothetical protein